MQAEVEERAQANGGKVQSAFPMSSEYRTGRSVSSC